MRSELFACLALAIGMAAVSVSAQVPEGTNPRQSEEVTDDEFRLPVNEETIADIDLFLSQLGSPLYKERDEATKQLMDIGAPAFARLRNTYAKTDDLEVRLRIEEIVHQAYLSFHVFDRNAFLGISQHRVSVTNDDDPRILEGQFGVKVAKIIADTAAQEAGIKKDDVIIALDGERLVLSGGDLIMTFGESIRVRGPGTLIGLTILRGKEQIDMDVVLGKRPREYYVRQGVVTEILRTTDRKFGTWWVKYFRQAPQDRADE